MTWKTEWLCVTLLDSFLSCPRCRRLFERFGRFRGLTQLNLGILAPHSDGAPFKSFLFFFSLRGRSRPFVLGIDIRFMISSPLEARQVQDSWLQPVTSCLATRNAPPNSGAYGLRGTWMPTPSTRQTLTKHPSRWFLGASPSSLLLSCL